MPPIRRTDAVSLLEKITTLEQRLPLLLDAVEKSRRELREAQADRGRLRQQLGDKDKLLADKDQELARTSGKLETQKSELADKTRQLAEKSQILSGKDKELAGKNQELDKKDKALADKDQQLGDKDALLAEKDTLIEAKEALLAEKEKALADLQKNLRKAGGDPVQSAGLKGEVASLQEALKKAESRSTDLSEQLETEQAARSAAEAGLAEALERLDKLVLRLEALDTDLAALEEQTHV